MRFGDFNPAYHVQTHGFVHGEVPGAGGCLRTQTPSSVLVRAQQSVLVANAYFVPEGGGKRVATFGKILHLANQFDLGD